MFCKKFVLDDDGRCAQTLPKQAVCESHEKINPLGNQRTHASGWTIKGVVQHDEYYWVNDFEATHEKYGRVWGNFENEVYADSESGYNHFCENHPFKEWDYADI